jgi:hypothetical protein
MFLVGVSIYHQTTARAFQKDIFLPTLLSFCSTSADSVAYLEGRVPAQLRTSRSFTLRTAKFVSFAQYTQ